MTDLEIYQKIFCKNGHNMKLVMENPYEGSEVLCTKCEKSIQIPLENFYHCGECELQDYCKKCASNLKWIKFNPNSEPFKPKSS